LIFALPVDVAVGAGSTGSPLAETLGFVPLPTAHGPALAGFLAAHVVLPRILKTQ
jgi:hypothetical protein